LLLTGGPSTVVRCVAFVIINSLECQFRLWAQTHIGKEILEYKPPLADSYTPTTITWIRRVFLVGTALNHVSPSSVLWRVLHAMLRNSYYVGVTIFSPPVPVHITPAVTISRFITIFNGTIVHVVSYIFKRVRRLFLCLLLIFYQKMILLSTDRVLSLALASWLASETSTFQAEIKWISW